MLKYRYIILILGFVLFKVTVVISQNISATDSFNYNYDQKNFSRALNFWDDIDPDSIDYELQKRKGNCYFYGKKYDTSQHIYKRIFNNLTPNDTLELIDMSINIGNTWKKNPGMTVPCFT